MITLSSHSRLEARAVSHPVFNISRDYPRCAEYVGHWRLTSFLIPSQVQECPRTVDPRSVEGWLLLHINQLESYHSQRDEYTTDREHKDTKFDQHIQYAALGPDREHEELEEDREDQVYFERHIGFTV